MDTQQEDPISFVQCGFRHSHDVKALVEDIVRAESGEFATVMRQVVNEGLKTKYGVKIIGNRVLDRGDVPVLETVSRAS